MTENDKNNSELLTKDTNSEKNDQECAVNSSEESPISVKDETLNEESATDAKLGASTVASSVPTKDNAETEKEDDNDETFVFVDSDAPEEPNALERLTESIISDWQKRTAKREAEQSKEDAAATTADIPASELLA